MFVKLILHKFRQKAPAAGHHGSNWKPAPQHWLLLSALFALLALIAFFSMKTTGLTEVTTDTTDLT